MIQRHYDRADVIGGVITMAVGIGASIISLGYPLGSIAAIGPGVFPLILGGLLILLGAGVLIGAFGREGQAIPRMNVRATLWVVGGITAFGLLIPTAGLIPAILACVALSRLAEPGVRPMPVLVLGLALSALCWAIFVFALGLPLRILEWPF